MKKSYLIALAFFAQFCYYFVSSAADLPNGFAELRIAEGLDGTTVNYAPDGRLFVTQKKGLISIIKNGVLLSVPFLDIQDDVDNQNERGLQNMVFDPNFASNGYVYVYYCAIGTNHNRISRFTATGDVADHSSEVVILNLDVLASDIHNGGAMFFKDGKLFVTTGEGSMGSLAQSTTSLLGKVLRMNPDGSIPTDNPFYSTYSGNYRLIYALGFRNPYRASVQPGTGRVFINDVGGSNYEEINELFPGKNYGWPAIEGPRTTQTPPANYQDPLYAYPHSIGCCVGGGAFYNPTTANFPAAYVGKYFFGDYCGNYIKVLDPNTGVVTETFATNVNRPISFTIGADGTFYYLARGGLGGGSKDANTQSCCSEIWRIRFTNSGVPTISAQPSNVTVPIGGTAEFVVGASGNAPLTIQWQRNGINVAGANSYVYELPSCTLSDNGAQFRAVVTNSLGTVTSNTVTLKVVNNLPPTPTIILPTDESTYVAGTEIAFQGLASDPEDGALPPTSLTWEIIFHHATHTHPGMAPTTGITAGTFLTANREPASNVWYRIYLTATDSDGESTTIYKDVYPVLANITIATNSPGLKLELDGAEVSAPNTVTGVAGVIREIGAPATQTVNGINYQFVTWSDGGEAEHEITTPMTSQTYSAYYLPLFMEAEDVVMSGAQLKFGYPGFSGLGYADFVNATGDYVEWSFYAPTTASYKLDFRYANGTTKDRPLKLSVNGAVVEASKSFPPTGLWTDWNTVSSTLNLNAGTNTVRITTIGSNGGNVDYLLVSSGSPITPAVSAPEFTPVPGTYTTAQVVTLTTATAGATIYYTVDGATPTTSSLTYTGPFTVNATTTVRALAIKAAMGNSSVSSGVYTIDSAPPVNAFSLEAETATLVGALPKFSYAGFTGNGYADYTNLSGDYVEWSVSVPSAGQYRLDFRYANGTTKDRPLQISVNGVITEVSKSFPSTVLWTTWGEVSSTVNLVAGTNKVRAMCIGSSGGNIDHLTITPLTVSQPTVATPVATPSPGVYPASTNVSITTATPGATVYFTTDGSTPTTSSSKYVSAINVSTTQTIKAFASAPGMTNSAVMSGTYTISAAPYNATLEAENATRMGVLIKYAYTGFSGTGYGDYVNASGEYIDWSVNAPYTGQFMLTFRYANGTTKDRPLDLSLNGGVVEAAKSFPGTGLWTTWGTVSKIVTLKAGTNSVRLTSVGSSGANVDNMTVSNNLGARMATEAPVTNAIAQMIEGSVDGIEIYPVPSDDRITITSPMYLELTGLASMSGVPHKPFATRVSEHEIVVHLSGLSNGVYIINLQSTNKMYRKKIVIAR